MNETIDKARNPATPTAERCITSYPARRRFRPGAIYPPKVPGVRNAIDIHCHAHSGQQDALALAKYASENGMAGILFKTIGELREGVRPGLEVAAVREELGRWAQSSSVSPCRVWAGYGITMDNTAPSTEKLRGAIADGAVAVWMSVFNHAISLHKVGGLVRWWDKSADSRLHSDPLPWEDAVRHGHYSLDEKGRLKPLYVDLIRITVDAGVAFFFGHGTHREFFAYAELLDKLNYRRGVIDHPFSPFVDLSVDQMKQLAAGGVTINFTYDELSPLLGVDPMVMYQAIRAIGVDRCTLSSDVGEPLFPNSVEAMRQMRYYMGAFGLTESELDTVCCRNPARIVGVEELATSG